METTLPCTDGLSLTNDYVVYGNYALDDENLLYHTECSQEKLPYGYVYIPMLYSITFLVGFFGNLFVVVLMLRKRGSGRLVDTFVLNLAIADLVFVCTLPLWAVSAALDNRWLFGAGLCTVSSYSIAMTRYSGTLFLTGMSLDRYLAVVKAHKSRALRTRRCILATSSGIWVISVLLGIPTLASRRLLPGSKSNSSVCADISSVVLSGTKLALLVLTFLLPLAIILFCYCSISARLRQHYQQGRSRRNSLKIIFSIVGTFICFWLPFNALSCVLLFYQLEWVALSCGSTRALSRGLTLTACLAFTNSCVNPLIYTLLDHHFRQQVLQQALRFFQKPKAAETPAGSSITFSSQSSAFFHPRN